MNLKSVKAKVRELRLAGGGPAFPAEYTDKKTGSKKRSSGMTLRQWYAGQALASMYSSDWRTWSEADIENRAKVALYMADVMLRVGAKKPEVAA